MLAHYLVANVGFKVAPYRFQIAGWWPLVFQPKACCLQSGPYKVALIMRVQEVSLHADEGVKPSWDV